MKLIALVALFAVLLSAVAAAYECPYTKAQTPTEYANVVTSPVVRYVGKEITFTVTDVFPDSHSTPAANRIIIVYYLRTNTTGSNASISQSVIYTDSSGVAKYTPEDSGRYAIATSHRYIFFDVLAKCGDNRCTYGEDRVSCSADCAHCGDGVCDVNEDKEKCPRDCVVCGDGLCDTGENRVECPSDCAHCGDSVCDVNEDRVSCPLDCGVCGDGVCDLNEDASVCPEDCVVASSGAFVGLNDSKCLGRCVVCGNNYCEPGEDGSNCPSDCAKCGDRVCNSNEDSVNCPADCVVFTNESCAGGCVFCGNDECDAGETGGNCPEDCSVCGNGVCEATEIEGLHKTNCAADCAMCGDGYCDKGESATCETDCKDKLGSAFIGYLLIPIALIVMLVLFEITHHFAVHKHPNAAAEIKEEARKTKLRKMDIRKVFPYLLIFAITLAAMTVMLAVLDLRYEKNLAILDVGMWLINNGPVISLIVVSLAAGIGLLARATYYMERDQALKLTLIFTILGMVPGLLIFLSLEYLVLMAGVVFGAAAATYEIKSEETDFAVKKSFKIGSDAADRMLTLAVALVCVMVFVQLYAGGSTSEKLSAAISNSQATKAMVVNEFGPQASAQEVEKNVAGPFLEGTTGGIGGRLLLSGGAALLLFGIVKLFISVIRLAAGFFSWLLDRSGFV